MLYHVTLTPTAPCTVVRDVGSCLHTHRIHRCAWRGMQEKIKSKYTIESERLMFEALFKGASVEEALAICKAAQAKLAQDDIELF
jgi:hypothetical protein